MLLRYNNLQLHDIKEKQNGIVRLAGSVSLFHGGYFVDDLNPMIKELGVELKENYFFSTISKKYDINLIKEELKKILENGPVLAGYNTFFAGHTVLLTGILGDKVIYHDPWSGSDLLMPVGFLVRKIKSLGVYELQPLDESVDN